MTQVAIVILNYNGEELLKKFLPSVLKFSSGSKIIVADNNSSDSSVDFLDKEFPQVEVIRIPSNLGYCGGYNYALSRVEAKYYVLLNSDVEVTENWIDPVISVLENDVSVGAAQPKILSYADKTSFEYAGAAGGFIDTLGYPFCRGRIFNSLEKDNHQYDDCLPIFWATGACLFIRSDLFNKMGGFDEDFFAHMEEIDLCWKLKRAGYSIFYQGASTIYHVGGGTLAATSPRKTYFNFRNGLSLIYKHHSFGQLLWKLPFRFLLDWLAAFKFLWAGTASSSLAILKAHINFVITFPHEIKKRRLLKNQIPGFEVNRKYRGLIIFDYYFRNRRNFENLKW